MATPKYYKYWNEDGSRNYEKMEGKHVPNPEGYTGSRSVEYVRPGTTKVYYPDRTLTITFTESPQKFRRKVKQSMGGNVRPREQGNQIIVTKPVRDQIRTMGKMEERAGREQAKFREAQKKAQIKEREAQRRALAKEREAQKRAQAKAKAKAKAKSKKSKKSSRSRRDIGAILPTGFAQADMSARPLTPAQRKVRDQVRNVQPKTVYQPVRTRPAPRKANEPRITLADFDERPVSVPKSHIWDDIDLNQF